MGGGGRRVKVGFLEENIPPGLQTATTRNSDVDFLAVIQWKLRNKITYTQSVTSFPPTKQNVI